MSPHQTVVPLALVAAGLFDDPQEVAIVVALAGAVTFLVKMASVEYERRRGTTGTVAREDIVSGISGVEAKMEEVRFAIQHHDEHETEHYRILAEIAGRSERLTVDAMQRFADSQQQIALALTKLTTLVERMDRGLKNG